MHGLYLVTAYLELDDFISTELALLYLAMTGNDDEELPLGVVPVLALGDSRLGDIDAYLTDVGALDKLGERAALIDVHLQRKRRFLFRQIAQIGRVKRLGKRTIGNLGDNESLWLRLELLQ